MPYRSINVTQPHSLTQQAAWDRVLATLQAQKDKPSLATVKVSHVDLDLEQYRLIAKVSITVLGHVESHTLTFAVEAAQVRVTSDQPDNMIEAGEMLVEERELKAMLEEALK